MYCSSESRFPWCIDKGERNRSAAFLDDVRSKFSARVCSVAGHFETFLYRMLAALMSRKKVARLKTSKKKEERWESLRERERERERKREKKECAKMGDGVEGVQRRARQQQQQLDSRR